MTQHELLRMVSRDFYAPLGFSFYNMASQNCDSCYARVLMNQVAEDAVGANWASRDLDDLCADFIILRVIDHPSFHYSQRPICKAGGRLFFLLGATPPVANALLSACTASTSVA